MKSNNKIKSQLLPWKGRTAGPRKKGGNQTSESSSPGTGGSLGGRNRSGARTSLPPECTATVSGRWASSALNILHGTWGTWSLVSKAPAAAEILSHGAGPHSLGCSPGLPQPPPRTQHSPGPWPSAQRRSLGPREAPGLQQELWPVGIWLQPRLSREGGEEQRGWQRPGQNSLQLGPVAWLRRPQPRPPGKGRGGRHRGWGRAASCLKGLGQGWIPCEGKCWEEELCKGAPAGAHHRLGQSVRSDGACPLCVCDTGGSCGGVIRGSGRLALEDLTIHGVDRSVGPGRARRTESQGAPRRWQELAPFL
uniref:Uncharacterized protein n=1 Tax=Myotis myotis TaxID=51298 RepID=A0A7J7SS34_MYOMY|nr:hypothetical protein mMyoMyo1_009413 [Myotis myotis]